MRAKRRVAFYGGRISLAERGLAYKRERNGVVRHGGVRPRRRADDLWDVYCYCGWSATSSDGHEVAEQQAEQHLAQVQHTRASEAATQGAKKATPDLGQQRRATPSASKQPARTIVSARKPTKAERNAEEARRRGISVPDLVAERRRAAAADVALAAEAKRLGVSVKSLRRNRQVATVTPAPRLRPQPVCGPESREGVPLVLELWAAGTGQRLTAQRAQQVAGDQVLKHLARYDAGRLQVGLNRLLKTDRKRTLDDWLEVTRTTPRSSTRSS